MANAEKPEHNQESSGEAIQGEGKIEGKACGEEIRDQAVGQEADIDLKSPRFRVKGGILEVEIPMTGKEMAWVLGHIQFSLIPWIQAQFIKAAEEQNSIRNKLNPNGGVRPDGKFMGNLRQFMKGR